MFTVSLLPSLARGAETAPSVSKPASGPAAPTNELVSVQPAEAVVAELDSRPDQLAPVSLTTEPVALSTPSHHQPAAILASPAGEPGSTTCDLTSALQASLQASPDVLEELAHIPRRARSVANAIMLWDGRWAEIETPGYPAMTDPLHEKIIAQVRSLSSACRAQPIAGPRLLTIANPDGTTVIALGSGAWRWGDLLVPEIQ